MEQYFMKNTYLLFGAMLLLLGCTNHDTIAIDDKKPWDFPPIDNTKEMGVSTDLSAPTVTDVKLDSMKIFYYQDYAGYSNNFPEMASKVQTKETPVAPYFYEIKHYFTYHKNGFLDKRTILYNDFYNKEKFKFIFDFTYLDNQLAGVTLDFYENNNLQHSIFQNYDDTTEKVLLDKIQANQFNIVSLENKIFVTPKNVYNPERNLLPSNVKLQFAAVFYAAPHNGIYDDLLEPLLNYFIHDNYINTHVTFLKEHKNLNGFVIPIDNIQYKVRQDHYPEIIQYGNVKNGGFKYLYYYNK